VSRRFAKQKRRDTAPELALRREIHRRGLRYRINYPVPSRSRRSIDIAFPKRHLAVFVDGCFWHACPEHSVESKSNSNWWVEKLEGNVRRDQDTNDSLVNEGWRVLRFWEHDLRSEASVSAATDYVEELVSASGSNSASTTANSVASSTDRSR